MKDAEFPITFNLYRGGVLLSSHSVRNVLEEKGVVAAVSKGGEVEVRDRFDVNTDTRPANDIPEIRALKLVTIYCDGSTTLASLTHGVLLSDSEGECPLKGVPHVYLTGKDENAAEGEFFGEVTDAGFPGWPAVFAYLNAHPERLDQDDQK